MFTKSDIINYFHLEIDFNKSVYDGAQRKLKELRNQGYWESSEEIMQVFEDIKNITEEEILLKEALNALYKQ